MAVPQLQEGAAIGMAIAAGLGACGAAIGDGILFGKSVEGIGRQPEAEKLIMGKTWVFYGMVEALPVIAIVVGFILMSHM